MKKKSIIFIALLGLIGMLCSFSIDNNVNIKKEMSHEYELKLAFIKQFPLFIQWPSTHSESDKFLIGIYGENHFKPFLKDLETRTINNRMIRVIEISDASKVKGLDILFISALGKKEIADLIFQCKTHHVLSVADRMGMIEKGVLINFFIENNNVRFELNKKELDANQFKVSSRLWRMGKIIE